MIQINSSVAEAIPNTEVRGQICTIQITLALARITGGARPRLGFGFFFSGRSKQNLGAGVRKEEKWSTPLPSLVAGGGGESDDNGANGFPLNLGPLHCAEARLLYHCWLEGL